jgi:AcrR family transcriptional regulator
VEPPPANAAKPTRPRKDASLSTWALYLKQILGWLETNQIPATIADFCQHAGVSRSTLRRKYPDIRERAYAYAQSSCGARSRPRPAHTESQTDRLRKAVYRECDRLTAEVAKLKRDLAEEKRQNNRLRPLAEEADRQIRELKGAVDTLTYELCREDPRRGREVERMLQSFRQKTVPRKPAK